MPGCRPKGRPYWPEIQASIKLFVEIRATDFYPVCRLWAPRLMSDSPAKSPLSEADFEAIAAAVNETERGRWFLTEYARRNRHSDTRQVLEAIEKLQNSMAGRASASPSESIRSTIFDMSRAIARTKAEIAAIKPSEDSLGKIGDATVELDAIVSTTEQATSEILAAAENVQEIAWTLREQGLDAGVCDQLDALMTQTYTACSFQDLTGQRIRKIVNVLNFLEARVEAMNLIWGKHETPAETAEPPSMEASLLNGPALPGMGLEQPSVDELIDPASATTPHVEAGDDIVWEDSPVEDGMPREAAVEAAVKLIAENISADDIAEPEAEAEPDFEENIEEDTGAEIAPLAPEAPPVELKTKAPAPAPIEQLSEIEKLAIFS